MFDNYKKGNCTICSEYFLLLHWHHTIPQALGGADSLQIPLCSDCHNVLHANAVAIVAKIKNGTPLVRKFWAKPETAQRAEPYLGILVTSILTPPIEPGDKEYKLQVPLTNEFHRLLKILKKEIGANSLPKAILYCIAFTLKSRGILNNGHRQEYTTKDNSNPKKPTPDLW